MNIQAAGCESVFSHGSREGFPFPPLQSLVVTLDRQPHPASDALFCTCERVLLQQLAQTVVQDLFSSIRNAQVAGQPPRPAPVSVHEVGDGDHEHAGHRLVHRPRAGLHRGTHLSVLFANSIFSCRCCVGYLADRCWALIEWRQSGSIYTSHQEASLLGWKDA
jgi:hypothetical protein